MESILKALLDIVFKLYWIYFSVHTILFVIYQTALSNPPCLSVMKFICVYTYYTLYRNTNCKKQMFSCNFEVFIFTATLLCYSCGNRQSESERKEHFILLKNQYHISALHYTYRTGHNNSTKFG